MPIHIIKNIPFREIYELLDRQVLFRQRWGYRALGQKERLGLEAKLLAMWQELLDRYLWCPAASWAVLRARWEKGQMVLEGVRPNIAFFLRPERLSGKRQRILIQAKTVAVQAVTMGRKASGLVKNRHSLVERYYWHGLLAEAADALAAWCSQRVSVHFGWDEVIRLSPGYPCWPELSEQRKIFKLLRPKVIGLALRRNLQLEPEYSTTALVLGIDKGKV